MSKLDINNLFFKIIEFQELLNNQEKDLLNDSLKLKKKTKIQKSKIIRNNLITNELQPQPILKSSNTNLIRQEFNKETLEDLIYLNLRNKFENLKEKDYLLISNIKRDDFINHRINTVFFEEEIVSLILLRYPQVINFNTKLIQFLMSFNKDSFVEKDKKEYKNKKKYSEKSKEKTKEECGKKSKINYKNSISQRNIESIFYSLYFHNKKTNIYKINRVLFSIIRNFISKYSCFKIDKEYEYTEDLIDLL